jgi:hypothetical protein
MAHSTLPVFSHPDFPQVFEAALNQLVTRQVPQLSPCCYESAESRWGAGDAIACTQPAVIHDVATELDYCFAHYKAVNRG